MNVKANEVLKKCSAVILSAGLMSTVFADGLSLTGSGDVEWNRTSPIWSDGSGLVPYADGADVTIGSQYTGSLVSFPDAMRINPGKVKFDIADGRTVRVEIKKSSSGSGFGPQTKSYEKTGAGTLAIRFENFNDKTTARTQGNQSSCDWDVYGGTLIGYGSEWWRNFNTFGATLTTNVNINVHDGAILAFNCARIGGDYDVVESEEDTGLCVMVEKGGTFRPMNEDVTYSGTTYSGRGFSRLREINLNGGTLDICRDGAANVGSFKVTHLFSFDGDTPYKLDVDGKGWDHAGFAFAATRLTELRVADITKDDTTDVDIHIPIRKTDKGLGTTTMGFRKTGAGRLELSKRNNYGDRAVDGDIKVEEGVLEYSAESSLVPHPDRTVTVEDDAALDLSKGFAFTTNKGWSAGMKTEVVVKKGGRYVIREKSGETKSHQFVGSLDLQGGTFDYSAMPGYAASGLCLFTLGPKVSMSGDTPYAWNSSCLTKLTSGYSNAINLSPGGTVFDIADITGNENTDFLLKHGLMDDGLTSSACGFVKTGAGTMCIDSRGSLFSGNVIVSNGVLRLGAADGEEVSANGNYSYVGHTAKPHTVEVAGSGVLYLANRVINTAPTANGTNTPSLVSYVVRKGGVLELNRNNGKGYAVFGDLWLDGGQFVYHQGLQGSGVGFITGTFKFSGDTPYEFNHTAIRQHISINAWPQTVFDVADITGDGDPDVSMNIALTVPPQCRTDHKLREGYMIGFRKTGAGTLRLGYAYDYGNEDVSHFNGDVTVENGTLQVDTLELTKCRTVIVNAGATLCGNGKVNNVVLAEGASLSARYNQESPLVVTGSATFPENGFVNIVAPAGTPDEAIASAAVVKTAGSETGSLVGWQVKVNGTVNPNIRLVSRKGVLMAKFNKGLAITIR